MTSRWHSCPILSHRVHPIKQRSICCRSEKFHLISEKWTKCCRFDRFVRFVKWKIDKCGCRSDNNCISLVTTATRWKCCRFDRFVRFVKWKSLLSIRQVRLSIGQLHLISDNGDPVKVLSIRSIRSICQMEKFTIDSTSAVVDRTIIASHDDDDH